VKETYVDQDLDLVLLEIATDLGRQQDTSAGAEFAILLVEFPVKHEFFKVDESHGHRRLLVATFIQGQLFYLPFQAAGRQRETGRVINNAVGNRPGHLCRQTCFRGHCSLYLLILLRVSLMWGNFSLKVSFMLFLRSEGLTYSMTVV